MCAFGALPFILSHTEQSFTDAVFESISAIATTGATVLSGLDSMPKDRLLWRSMMQWLGGLGIIALGTAVLPFLRIGGMRLFNTESSDLSEKTLPNTRRILNRLLVVYLTQTGITRLTAVLSLGPKMCRASNLGRHRNWLTCPIGADGCGARSVRQRGL